MDEFVIRARLVRERFSQLSAESERTSDLERLRAIQREMDLLNDNMREIHVEQLQSMLPAPEPAKRKGKGASVGALWLLGLLPLTVVTLAVLLGWGIAPYLMVAYFTLSLVVNTVAVLAAGKGKR